MENEPLYAAVGAAIRARREELGLTQTQVADRVAMSRASVTNIECGRQSLLLDQLYRFAEALETTPMTLLATETPRISSRVNDQLSSEANAWIERLRRSSH